MKATLTTSEFNEFCAKVDTLESKGYDMSFTVDRTPDGNFDVEIIGEHDIEELDRLTETGQLMIEVIEIILWSLFFITWISYGMHVIKEYIRNHIEQERK